MTGLGAIGKLADFDEYVSLNAQSPLFIAFDRWVTDGMDATPEASPDWAACYHAGAVQAFVYSPLPARPFLVGALAPSADRAGRKYPLFVGQELAPDAITSLETLPLSLEGAWEDASRVVRGATQAGTVASLKEFLAAGGSGTRPDLTGALEAWKSWVESMRLEELEELLFGGAGPGGLAGAVRATLEAAVPHRGVVPRRTRLSVRLPLG